MAVRVVDVFSEREPVLTKVSAREGGARQEFKDECDINRIMKRVLKGQLVPAARGAPRFGDFSRVEDFHWAQNVLVAAEAQFARLPSEVRKRFGNSPVRMLEFVHNDKNRDEAVKLGLVQAPVAEKIAKVEVVNAVPAGGQKPA